jgi:hypothetical protein
MWCVRNGDTRYWLSFNTKNSNEITTAVLAAKKTKLGYVIVTN